MGLFDDLFGKDKYPNNRKQKGGRMERVYAGPEQMSRRRRPEEDEPVMEDLYAGPLEADVIEIRDDADEWDDEDENAKSEECGDETENSEQEEAGDDPGDAEKKGGNSFDSEEMRRRMEQVNVMAVYAGPEQMSQPQIMFVYAGPAQMAKGPSGFMNMGPNMMLAYAGPNIKPPSMTGQPVVPEQAKPEDVEYVFCPCCGYKIVSGCRFCPECGAPQKKKSDDGTELC